MIETRASNVLVNKRTLRVLYAQDGEVKLTALVSVAHTFELFDCS